MLYFNQAFFEIKTVQSKLPKSASLRPLCYIEKTEISIVYRKKPPIFSKQEITAKLFQYVTEILGFKLKKTWFQNLGGF